jgi:hypothetical protein
VGSVYLPQFGMRAGSAATCAVHADLLQDDAPDACRGGGPARGMTWPFSVGRLLKFDQSCHEISIDAPQPRGNSL